MRGKLAVAAVMHDGRIGLVEEDTLDPAAGCVLLEVKSSLMSPGTELAGWRGLARGDSRAGPGGRPRTFGYSNAGVVLDLGQGVTDSDRATVSRPSAGDTPGTPLTPSCPRTCASPCRTA